MNLYNIRKKGRLANVTKMLLFLIIAMLMHVSQVMAATYYVDFENGSDSNSGLSISEPWKHSTGDDSATGVPSITNLSPGDLVIFKGGVEYLSTVDIDWSGTSGKYITYRGNTVAGDWGSGRAFFDGEAKRVHALRPSGAPNYIKIINFDMYDQTMNNGNSKTAAGAINVAGTNWLIKDVSIYDAHGWDYEGSSQPACGSNGGIPQNVGLMINGWSHNTSDIEIDNLEIYAIGRTAIEIIGAGNIDIHDSNFGGKNVTLTGSATPASGVGWFSVAIRLHYGVNNVNVYDNVFHDGWQYEGNCNDERAHAGDWIHAYGDADGVEEPNRDPHNITVERNYFYNDVEFTHAIGTANTFVEEDVYNITYRNNIMVNPHHFGIAIQNALSGVVIENNTIITYPMSNGSAGFWLTSGSRGAGVTLYNNISIHLGSNTTDNCYYYGVTSGINDSDYNLCYKPNGSDGLWRVGGSYYTLKEWQNASIFDDNSLSGNPSLIFLKDDGKENYSGPATDYALSYGSIAIGAGTDLSNTFTDDYSGTKRSFWNLGAFEGSVIDDGVPPASPSGLFGVQVE